MVMTDEERKARLHGNLNAARQSLDARFGPLTERERLIFGVAFCDGADHAFGLISESMTKLPTDGEKHELA
jgi:hypothetical protein